MNESEADYKFIKKDDIIPVTEEEGNIKCFLTFHLKKVSRLNSFMLN